MGTEELPLRSQVSKQLVVNRDNAESEHYMNTKDIDANLWNCEIWKDLILKYSIKATPAASSIDLFIETLPVSLHSLQVAKLDAHNMTKKGKITKLQLSNKELFLVINCS